MELRKSRTETIIRYLYNCIVSFFRSDCKTNLLFCRCFFRKPSPGGYFLPNLCTQQKQKGAGFVVVVPSGNEQAALLQDKGFQWAFPLRGLPREVDRNLWSQAEFDTVTAKKLCELRARFWPDTVSGPQPQIG